MNGTGPVATGASWKATTFGNFLSNPQAGFVDVASGVSSADIGSSKRRWGQFDQEKAAETMLRTVLGAVPSETQGYESPVAFSSRQQRAPMSGLMTPTGMILGGGQTGGSGFFPVTAPGTPGMFSPAIMRSAMTTPGVSGTQTPSLYNFNRRWSSVGTAAAGVIQTSPTEANQGNGARRRSQPMMGHWTPSSAPLDPAAVAEREYSPAEMKSPHTPPAMAPVTLNDVARLMSGPDSSSSPSSGSPAPGLHATALPGLLAEFDRAAQEATDLEPPSQTDLEPSTEAVMLGGRAESDDEKAAYRPVRQRRRRWRAVVAWTIITAAVASGVSLPVFAPGREAAACALLRLRAPSRKDRVAQVDGNAARAYAVTRE